MLSPRALIVIAPTLFLLAAIALGAESPRSAEAGSSDVVVENLYYWQETPGGPTENVAITIQIVVANAGESGTGTFGLDFYRDREDPPGQFDVGDQYCSMDPMGPTSSVQCDVTVTYEAAGTYKFWIQLDREGQVWESDETNNISGPNYLAIDDDSDFDTVGDQYDNCLFWPNPTQTQPSWTIPPNDSDCDGFANARETYLTTDSTLQCAATSNTGDENASPDRWPLDFNDNQFLNTVDVGNWVGKLGLDNTETAAGWTPRLDLNQSANGLINTVDVGFYVGKLGRSCSLSGS